MIKELDKTRIVVVGLGYVGLPLCCLLAGAFENVVGFDLNRKKVKALNNGENIDDILTPSELSKLTNAKIVGQLPQSDMPSIYIVAVPTPIGEEKLPDLSPLEAACDLIASVLKKGDVVVFESTVYPGATREVCVPRLEIGANLQFDVDFAVGYSPERVNPGDRTHTIDKIVKIVSASDELTGQKLCAMYGAICTAGIHYAESIEVAEAAKVIENVQRDVNIALVNELDVIFSNIGINTLDVLSAARTKWNFVDVRPGLVGGHCIGVDPYYLIHRARRNNAEPRLIEGARYVNENYATVVLDRFYKWVIKNSVPLAEKRIIFYGVAFKPDCADTRNSQMYRVIEQLREDGFMIQIFDDVVGINEVNSKNKYDMLMIGTQHKTLIDHFDTLMLQCNCSYSLL